MATPTMTAVELAELGSPEQILPALARVQGEPADDHRKSQTLISSSLIP